MTVEHIPRDSPRRHEHGATASEVTTAAGRTAPLAALFSREYAGMVRLAVLLVGSNEVAEECVQEAFVRVHRRWSRISSPGAYLRTAVINVCRDHQRRQRGRRAFRPDPVPPEVIPEHDDELAGLLHRLPGRQRAAIVLRFYVDLADTEIADHLGCRPATVRSLVHRGLATLRQELRS